MAYVEYKCAGTAGQPSPVIWATFNALKARANPGEYIDIWDDFTVPVVTDTSVSGWEFVGTNPDVDNVADVVNGQILLEGSGADNDAAFVCSNDLYLLTKNSGKRFWFEASVQLTNAGTTDDYSAFVGLVESAGATAGLIANNGATVIDEDFVGWFADTNATTIQPWNATINIGSSGNFPVNAKADAVAVSTSYVKLGITFDGKQTLKFYSNGVLIVSYDVDNLDLDTMNHEFCVALGVKDCEAAQLGMNVDWVRFACEKNASGY